ncbi:MAG: hypothetical protein M1823_006007 [Watsoniomyces obsoletus]|nr:MAG: hypothetical protein M1823_006007 [Watsoniomyces obsoletus]
MTTHYDFAVSPATEDSTPILRFLSQWGVLICPEHQQGIIPASLESHLDRQHRAIIPDQRRALLASIQSTVTHLLPNEIVYPTAVIDALPELEVLQGFQCILEDCNQEPESMSVSRQTVLRHRNHVHGPQHRGREVGLQRVLLQTFFTQTSHRRLFLVQRPLATAPELPEESQAVVDTNIAVQVQAQFQSLRQADEQSLESQLVQEPNSLAEDTPWLRRSGFVQHLKGFDKRVLRTMVSTPQEHPDDSLHAPLEQLLFLLHKQSIKMLHVMHRQANLHGADGNITRAEACILNSLERGRIQSRPFQTVAWDDTVRRYATHWADCLCYIVRMLYLQRQQADTHRPSVVITTQQHEKIRSLVQALRIMHRESTNDTSSPENSGADQQAVEESVWDGLLDVSMALIQQPLTGSRFENGICSFLAIKGLSATGQWLPPLQYTPILSALTYCVRLWLFGFYLKSRPSAPLHGVTDPSAQLQRLREREEMLQELCQQWLVNKQPTPMGEINALRLYGMSIARDTLPPSWISWSADGQTVCYKDKTITMEQWREWIKTMWKNARVCLRDELLLAQDDQPWLHVHSMTDLMAQSRPGYSFIQDPRNNLSGLEQWLITRNSKTPTLLDRFSRTHPDNVAHRLWKKETAQQYFQRARYFLEVMMALIHISSGLPARAPELLSTTFVNSEQLRNVLIQDGQLVIITSYHKSEWREGSRAVCRFVLPVVADLLVTYLVGVQPWLWFLYRVVQEASPGLPHLLFSVDGRGQWEDNRLSSVLDRESRSSIGVKMNISAWRHLAIAIDRRHLQGIGVKTWDIEHDGSDQDDGPDKHQAHHLQASHSARTGNRNYANSIDLRAGLTDQAFDAFRRVSHQWWALTGLLSDDLSSTTAARLVQQDGQEPGTRKASHKTNEPPPTVLSSPLPSQAVLNLHWPEEPTRPSANIRQWTPHQLELALKKLLGNNAAPRSSIQWDALLAVAQSVAQLIVVMPTGAGKSLLFQLPSILPGAAITIVILPLVALRQDLTQRCRHMKINYTDWTDGPLESSADCSPLLFASVEHTEHVNFRSFVHRTHLQGQLYRIVLDEAHLVITEVSYRPAMSLVQELRAVAVPFICLSATLPPAMIPRLCHKLHPPQSRILRATVDRPNLKYSVHVLSGPLVPQAVENIQLAAATLYVLVDWRILVYSNFVDNAQELAEGLGVSCYHGRLTQEERTFVLAEWIRGDNRILVGTSALGAGIDHPLVRYVFHVGAPKSALDYAQKSGRAGRDGTLAVCPIYVSLLGDRSMEEATPQDILGYDQHVMEEYIHTTGCRRKLLTSYLDGDAGQTCINPDVDNRCDNCYKELTKDRSLPSMTAQEVPKETPAQAEHCSLQSGQQLLQEQTKARSAAQNRYIELLRTFAGQCLFCPLDPAPYIEGSSLPHQWRVCGRQRKWEAYMEKKKSVVFEPYIGCYGCANPTWVCDQQGQGTCAYQDVVLGACYQGWLSRSRVIDQCRESNGIQPLRRVADYYRWLGQKTTFHGEEACWAARVAESVLEDEMSRQMQS